MCRDVDDPEYKPAPALLKDDMEVRPQEPKGECWLCDKAYTLCLAEEIIPSAHLSHFSFEYDVINAHCLLMQDDASSPGDLVVTDNAGGEY